MNLHDQFDNLDNLESCPGEEEEEEEFITRGNWRGGADFIKAKL